MQRLTNLCLLILILQALLPYCASNEQLFSFCFSQKRTLLIVYINMEYNKNKANTATANCILQIVY